ncbi:similar to Saccharomyces cerevisiae YPR063C ER-localized protein of unknown function [Maudiozyma barnettii]|uniref:Uncharacterized protein n=1 Tax=Maudiozyma barnettii TaxID=61262 RepID=A0A8H2VB88_9SACH|nr:hypothetical protein [Kazachstania barnettii]CAB4252057.1 similar to Saccharomyces cerevisiae YPR063C ER-localized protein of unknown function [Kazachstania barnettii]CAD1778531.1 similar to Saccharomyces cerevisiae YPR063C ER-localized protein of unknown function [Kazachstania barnettii]
MTLNNIKREDLSVKSPLAIYNSGRSQSLSGMLNQSMPLAAIFLRNKFLAWFAVVQGMHYLLNTDREQAARDASAKDPTGLDQSPFTRLLIAVGAIIICYIDFVFPQK